MEYYITKNIDELEKLISKAQGSGCVDIEFNPANYNLIHEDDRPELEDINTEDLIAELESRKREEIRQAECSITGIAKNVIEKSPVAAREFFTDILGLIHLASVDEICNAIREKL